MKFDWRNLIEEDFVDYCARAENNMVTPDEYIGCVRTGELCFDIVVRDYDEHLIIDFDLYVGGIDDGYGYSRIDDGYPYTEDGGGMLFEDAAISLSYDEFKNLTEGILTDFINNEGSSHSVSLIEKANEELHIW